MSARRLRRALAPLLGATLLLLVACGGSHETADAPPAQKDAPRGSGQFGDDCAQHSDCADGYCVEAVGGVGGKCTRACNNDCPPEWTCREVTIDGTAVHVCVPDAPQLCLACAADAECGTGAACLTIDTEKACATKCAGTCPIGYTCVAEGNGAHPGTYCQPVTKSCTCSAGMAGASRACTNTNTIGTCFGTQMCNPSTGWSACTAPDATLETCDGNDNDCDFLIDEDTGGGEACTNTVAGIGTCPGTRQCGGSIGYVCEGQIPSAEVCNYADEDCDGMVDEGFTGLGTLCTPGIGGCQRIGTVRCKADGTATECSVTAGTPTTELCNQVDDDCNGRTDETFPTLGSSCSVGTGTCQRFGTTVCASSGLTTTCSVSPGTPGTELCNQLDDNCNGSVDETFTSLGTGCSVGVGQCQRYGTTICASGGLTTTCSATAGSPVAELCNQLDDNCNGSVDETFTSLGTGCSTGIGACQRFGTTVCASSGTTTTCSATPGAPATEACNGIDDNCNGSVDETFTSLGTGCSVGVGACQRFGTTVCASGGATTTCSVSAGTPGIELCNAIDDDCDGKTDETFPTLGNACSAGLGVCQRFGTTVCAAGGMTTTCSATAGTNSSIESCNYLDDDCNGAVDNGFRNVMTGAYDMTPNCGSCGNDCTQVYTGANSTGACSIVSGTPQCVMVCAAGTSDLNNSSFDGCEFTLDATTVYVSITDTAAADDSTCGLGPTGSGTGNHPCRTITFGLSRATALGRANVRVADGTYNEAVTLASGKNLLGGYRPGTWDRHLSTTSTLIQGVSSSGNHDRTVIAVNVSNATFEGFVVRGSFNTKLSGNSYAIYISGGAATLAIKNNQIFAGRGGPGADGTVGMPGTTGPDGTGSVNGSYDGFITNGTPCSTTNNRQFANGAVFSCGADNVSGGNGGGNQCPPATDYTQKSAINGFAGQAGAGTGGGGAGGTSQAGYDGTLQIQGNNTSCFLPTPPMTGADGAPGGVGGNGAGVAGCSSSAGTVASGDWVNGSAPAGVIAFNGGGGGGGAAGGGGACTNCSGSGKDRLGAHGGGGGAGGCGGNGGGPGGAGGGVFGIFIVGGTAPTLSGNSIQRGTGGTAGAGGSGGVGGFGGRGGEGGAGPMLCSAKAGAGGVGGNGGYGSGGGGGCGGSSYGIFTSGVGTPTYCTTNTVSGGTGGSGGAGGFSIGNTGGTGAAGALQGCTSI